MVALPNSPEGPTGQPPGGGSRLLEALLLAWRRVLTVALAAGARARRRFSLSRASRIIVMGARYVRDPAGTLASADADGRARLKEAGASALALGVLLSFLVPAAVGAPLVRRFLAAGWTSAWALARLFIMRTVAGGELRRHGSTIDDSWGPALLPYAIAVIDPLPFVALAASGALALRGLRALGTERGEALRVVGIAFGAQVAAEVAAWLARGGLIYLLSLRG